jgi:hypothetical protein
MAVNSVPEAKATTPTSGEPRATLRRGAIGLVGVVFMVVAFSAPITAMTGNLPVAVGFGNGLGAPGGFVIATIVSTIFSIGFVAAGFVTGQTLVVDGGQTLPELPLDG